MQSDRGFIGGDPHYPLSPEFVEVHMATENFLWSGAILQLPKGAVLTALEPFKKELPEDLQEKIERFSLVLFDPVEELELRGEIAKGLLEYAREDWQQEFRRLNADASREHNLRFWPAWLLGIAGLLLSFLVDWGHWELFLLVLWVPGAYYSILRLWTVKRDINERSHLAHSKEKELAVALMAEWAKVYGPKPLEVD